MEYVKNMYFAYKEVNTTLDYKVILNIEDNRTLERIKKDGYIIKEVI